MPTSPHAPTYKNDVDVNDEYADEEYDDESYTDTETDSDDWTEFPLIFLKSIDNNAEEWMSSEESRAILAACAFLDYVVNGNNEFDIASSFYSSTIFIGRHFSDLFIGINTLNNEKSLIIEFDTIDTSKAKYQVFDFDNKWLETAFKAACHNGYYQVNPVDINEVYDILRNATEN